MSGGQRCGQRAGQITCLCLQGPTEGVWGSQQLTGVNNPSQLTLACWCRAADHPGVFTIRRTFSAPDILEKSSVLLFCVFAARYKVKKYGWKTRVWLFKSYLLGMRVFAQRLPSYSQCSTLHVWESCLKDQCLSQEHLYRLLIQPLKPFHFISLPHISNFSASVTSGPPFSQDSKATECRD